MQSGPSDEGGEWISITDAARRLTALGDPVDRSSLSRYLKQHSEALRTRQDGKSNLVEFGALQDHRRENVRLKPPRQIEVGGASSRGQTHRFPESQSSGVARKALADAEMREMDLAKRRGELTATAEVDQAGRDAVALMQAAFDRAVETRAASLNAKYGWDERLARIELKNFAKAGLDVFNRTLLEQLDAMDQVVGQDEAGEGTSRASALQ